jgi:hypothetical protein
VRPPTYSEKEEGDALGPNSKGSVSKPLEDVKLRETETELPSGREKPQEAPGPKRRPVYVYHNPHTATLSNPTVSHPLTMVTSSSPRLV